MASDDKTQAQTATQAGTSNTQVFDPKRPFNPLSKYSSYTYQFSLYAISPEYYDLFAQDKLKFDPTNKGVILVLQSGGINNTTQTRASGFEFDYYIDDVKIENVVAPEARQTSTVSYNFEFKVYEHLGFRFISNLKLALTSLKQYSPELQKLENASRVLFVMTIKFLGYDAQGNLLQDTDISGLQKNYDLILTSIKFKLDGNITIYSIKAVPIRMDVVGAKKGILKDGSFNLYGQTVEQVLTKLMVAETNNRKLANNNTSSDVLSVEFVGPGSEKISKATFVNPADNGKNTSPATGTATTTNKSNQAAESNAVPKLNEKEIKINTGTPIQKAIEEIIKLSSYIRDPLTKVQANEPNSNNEVKQDNKVQASWFNVTPKIEKVVRNQTLNDYMYNVKYVIQPYSTPDLAAPYIENVPSYFGPVKVYNYYYTGQNSEVIRFEQEFDNLYFTVALDAGGLTSRAAGGNAQIPTSTAVASGGSKLGAENPAALSAQNSMITYLLDPAKVATAKIEILGDPDWLGQDVISVQRYVNENNYTVNYSASQVFIEISIKEPIDYNHNTGTVDLNENIIFWNYPDYVREKLKGKISYRVIKVISTFKNGKFTQMLDMVLTPFPEKPSQTTNNQAARTTTNSTGLRTEGPATQPASPSNNAITPRANPIPSANDDTNSPTVNLSDLNIP